MENKPIFYVVKDYEQLSEKCAEEIIKYAEGKEKITLGTSTGSTFKKTYELLFVGFLEILLVLSIVVFNYINGYGGVVDSNNYVDHMNYVSMEFNIYIYIIFVGIIGLLTLNSFVSEKLVLLNKKEENVDTLEEKA